jgi:hypothetical protein
MLTLDRNQAESADRDQAARTAVYEAYAEARTSSADPHAKFEAALVAYCEAYPEISTWDARHHVAHILATHGL